MIMITIKTNDARVLRDYAGIKCLGPIDGDCPRCGAYGSRPWSVPGLDGYFDSCAGCALDSARDAKHDQAARMGEAGDYRLIDALERNRE